MGQKSNPIGLRLGINKSWDSVWFDEKNFSDRIKEDLVIRNYIFSRYPSASISKVLISRTSEKAAVTVNTARPGLIIGKGGTEVDALKKALNIDEISFQSQQNTLYNNKDNTAVVLGKKINKDMLHAIHPGVNQEP